MFFCAIPPILASIGKAIWGGIKGFCKGIKNEIVDTVKTFGKDGVKIWGQKNLQIRESQLNRIAVRRLLLRMRKLIAIACRSLIFEPNDPVTKNMFLTAVTPIMSGTQMTAGWECDCGTKNIQSKFCPECGAKKPEPKIIEKYVLENGGMRTAVFSCIKNLRHIYLLYM